MAKKYEKIGQANIYREKKQSGCGPIIGGIVIVIVVIALLSECSANAQEKSLNLILNEPMDYNAKTDGLNPSKLAPVAGQPRLLLYVEGDGNIAPNQFALEASTRGDRFAIMVSATPRYKAQALAHAEKLAEWLERKLEKVNHVPIVFHQNEKGVGFVYYISGLTYWGEEDKKIVMTPDEATLALEDAVWTYKARMEMRERGQSVDLLN